MSASSWLVRALTLTPFGILEPRNCFGAPITPGSTPVAITLDASALNKRAIYFECTVPAGVEWAAGLLGE